MSEASTEKTKISSSELLTAFIIVIMLLGLTTYEVARANSAMAELSGFISAAILVVAGIIPLIGDIYRRPYIYFLILPGPYVGSWCLSWNFWSLFEISPFLAGVLASAISLSLITSVHRFSRRRGSVSSAFAFSGKDEIKLSSVLLLFTGLFALGEARRLNT
ncbi:MAG: hypothetical protein WED04_09585 [Promethearchaeati archaeon SRVP18_Atabeyarchaeia-1]